jgi:DNA replication protein DnaC
VYGPVRTVVWQGSAGDRGPYADLVDQMLSSTFIDEFGYLNLKPEQSNTFFKLMEERYHRHSTIITTNLIYDEWQNFLGNKSMVEALLSRVRHYCHTVTINGPSLRDPQG